MNKAILTIANDIQGEITHLKKRIIAIEGNLEEAARAEKFEIKIIYGYGFDNRLFDNKLIIYLRNAEEIQEFLKMIKRQTADQIGILEKEFEDL